MFFNEANDLCLSDCRKDEFDVIDEVSEFVDA